MSQHKHAIGDTITTTTGKSAQVVELLPPDEGSDVPRYRVKTDIGHAVWGEDVLAP